MNFNIFNVLLLCFLPLFSLVARSAELPLGIPAPSFGLDEVAPNWPAEWPEAEKQDWYYIDNTHPAATDSSNKYGYPDKPRLNPPLKATLPEGAYMEIHGGPYPEANYDLLVLGTVEKPVFVRGPEDSALWPTLAGRFRLSGSSYLVLENIRLSGGSSNAVKLVSNTFPGLDTHHIAVRNCEIGPRLWGGGNSAGIAISAQDGLKTHDIVISNCEIHDLASEQSWETEDLDLHGINPTVFGRDATSGIEIYNIWVLNNTGYRISGNLVQVTGQNVKNGYAGDILHHIYVGGNTAYENRQAGFWSKTARHVVFSQNKSYNHRDNKGGQGDGAGYQYGPDYLWFIGNEFYGNNFGIRQSDTPAEGFVPQVFMIGNLIYDCQRFDDPDKDDDWREGVGVALWTANSKRYIVDNTIANCRTGLMSIYGGEIQMSGNIIYNIDSSEDFISASSAVEAGTFFIENNLFYDPEGRFSMYWSVPFDDSGLWQEASGSSNDVFEDPLFVFPSIDPLSKNYSILSISPAVGAGQSTAPDGTDVYALYESLYGVNIKTDLRGIPRVEKDLGAYEYEWNYTLDADGDGDGDANDGVMIHRRLVGASSPITNVVLPEGVGGSGASGEKTNQEVVDTIDTLGATLDVDGDADADANDGVMIHRRLTGAGTVITNIALPAGVGGTEADGSRSNQEVVEAIDRLIP